MLTHHNQQIKPSSKYFSFPSQNHPKTKDSKVIYKTQEELHAINDLGFKWLQNPNTQRATSPGVIFKIIMWREQELGKCITRIDTLAKEIIGYGYDKQLSTRQIKRIIKRLREIGLITYERCESWNNHSPYQYKATQLGKDVYYYFYHQNKSSTQYINLNLSTETGDNNLGDSKCHLEFDQNDQVFVQMSPRTKIENFQNPMNPGHVIIGDFINVTSLKDMDTKKDLDIHTRAREDKKPENFFVLDPYPEPEKEKIEMFVNYPTHNFTPEQAQVIQEILSTVETQPGDEQIFKDEIAQALKSHRERGIQVVDFRFFVNKVRQITWEKYYWDMRGGGH